MAELERGMYRNRKLLDLAHAINRCCNCGSYQLAGCEPAHSNHQEHGRGSHNKSHDCFFAALCHLCHRWLDSGGRGKDPSERFEATREGKREMFDKAKDVTVLELWKRELIAVI